MTVIIRDRETDQMLRELAAEEDVGLTTVVRRAVEDYRQKRRQRDDKEVRMRRLRAILDELDSLPVQDPRSAKEIMDDLYDEDGLPT